MMRAVFPIGSRATSSRGSASSSVFTRSMSPSRAAFKRSTTVVANDSLRDGRRRAQIVGNRVEQHGAEPFTR